MHAWLWFRLLFSFSRYVGRGHRTGLIAAWLLAMYTPAWGGDDSAAPADQSIDFALEVRPILSDKCFLCHGPDEGTREADLRLDTASGVEYAFADGKFAESEAWRRITSDDPDEQMPPPGAGKPLTVDERAVLTQWMKQGAAWTGHWSFQPIAEVEPPATEDWGNGPIDAFIHRGLRRRGLSPSERAPKAVLLRRASFDLTGLPPTTDQLDQFLHDESPDAYAQAVDRLLATPRYGERFAAVWLDVARYSDTFGYQRDEDRFVWPWRDWVVEALNNNLPYDEFVRQQIAGDLLDDATPDTILATTFNRLHGQNSEGGSIAEEFRLEYIADRTQTAAAAFLGLTMECCKCHDHKYDPLSQKDFYAFSAFFDKIDEAGIKSFFTATPPPPTLRLIDAEEQQQLDAKRANVEDALATLAETEQAERATYAAAAPLSRTSPVALPTPVAEATFEEPVEGGNRSTPGVRGQAIELSGDDEAIAASEIQFDRADAFSFSLWLRTDRVHRRAVVFHGSRAALDSASRGLELLIEDGRLLVGLNHFWPGNALQIKAVEQVPVDRWVHVAWTYDGSSRASGLKLYIDGRPASVDVIRDGLTRTIADDEVKQIKIGARFRDRGFTGGQVDEFRIYDRRLSAIEVARLMQTEAPASLLGVVEMPQPDKEAWFRHYLFVESDAYRAAREKLQSLRTELYAAEDQTREIMVMRDYPGAPETRIRIRGAYDQLGESVAPDTPAVLPPLPSGDDLNRAVLAEWLVSEQNPLTARVAVNRLWQTIFGKGLVRTPEDFGAQGEPPTHPELLDYLAREYIASGWDTKQMIRRMVLSETYQQSSTPPAAAFKADPENRTWNRAERRRWPAEMLRDNALAASGLLSTAMGGPPVKPYEIEASFSPSPRDAGDSLYRRSLYTYFKRSAPAPVMATFDVPDRSVCRVKRERTLSPLQALAILNGPQFVEAARVLAAGGLTSHGDDDAALVDYIFRQLTSQWPNDDERRILRDLLSRQRELFAEHPEHAAALLEVGDRAVDPELDAADLAAATVVAQVVMSYDKSMVRQ